MQFNIPLLILEHNYRFIMKTLILQNTISKPGFLPKKILFFKSKHCDQFILINIYLWVYMSQGEWFTTYLQYENLKDLLNIILYTSQSFMAITPMLYYINYKEKDILFVHTGIVGGVVAHYIILNEKPSTKFVELNKITSDYKFTNTVGNNSQSIYIPIVKLVRSTLAFPLTDSSM